MRIACTGFVSEKSGSVAAANALLLCKLLEHGVEADFFSKPSFVDPRPIVGPRAAFRFIPVRNRFLNSVREKTQAFPAVSTVTGMADAYSYNRLVVRFIRMEHVKRHYDLTLWLGDYARGSVPGLPTVSFVQGPPGTDARSLLAQAGEISNLTGPLGTIKWGILARFRLSRLGRPPLEKTDSFIVGSRQSFRTLTDLYGIAPNRISTLPYPIDLELFQPPTRRRPKEGPLRALWLGRIVPRKRLDIFLGGAALAIRQGADLKLTLVGKTGLIPEYDRMIRDFPYPERLERHLHIDRMLVPRLLHDHDVLAQPSDEENFGSSVAEAQACGLPVIVGRTSGNADYLSSRDIHLTDDRTETFAYALLEMCRRKARGELREAESSRIAAEKNFHVDRVTEGLLRILKSAI
jgi:glycosyltransferase involved in cell wall biosynthesis